MTGVPSQQGPDDEQDLCVKITDTHISPDTFSSFLEDPSCGAVVTFSGCVRNHSHGRTVLQLEYEAYPEMALREMQQIARETQTRFAVRKIAMIHRFGMMQPGDMAVFLAVCSGHRETAFSACRHLIDTIKQRVPIWKKEHYADGTQWIEGPDTDQRGDHHSQ